MVLNIGQGLRVKKASFVIVAVPRTHGVAFAASPVMKIQTANGANIVTKTKGSDSVLNSDL